jgi:Holliday junction resolvase
VAEEKRFENVVKKFLKDHGCYYVKYWGGGTYTRSGVPDLLVSVNGYFIGVELKATHGRPSPLQLYNLKLIRESGGVGILLYPRNLAHFKMFVIDILHGARPTDLIRKDEYAVLRW